MLSINAAIGVEICSSWPAVTFKALSAETLRRLASEAVDVRSGLERLLQEETAEASDLKRYQGFFLRLAVSLGL